MLNLDSAAINQTTAYRERPEACLSTRYRNLYRRRNLRRHFSIKPGRYPWQSKGSASQSLRPMAAWPTTRRVITRIIYRESTRRPADTGWCESLRQPEAVML